MRIIYRAKNIKIVSDKENAVKTLLVFVLELWEIFGLLKYEATILQIC